MPVRLLNRKIEHNFVTIKVEEFSLRFDGVDLRVHWREDDDDARLATLYIGKASHPKPPKEEGIITTDAPDDFTRMMKGLSIIKRMSPISERFEAEVKPAKAASIYHPLFERHTTGIMRVLAAVFRMILLSEPSEADKKLVNLAATIDTQFNSYNRNNL